MRRVPEVNRTTNWKGYVVIRLLLLAVCGFGLTACEIDTTVSIADSKIPPKFSLSGNGQLQRFIVVGPYAKLEQMDDPKSDARAIWEVFPDDRANKRIDSLPQITYGQVPTGFEQMTPVSGAPPPLEEGKFYSIGTPSISANFRVLCFKVEHDQAVKVPCRER